MATTGCLYLKAVDGSWVPLSVGGPQGPKGDKGDPGAPGGLQWDDIMGMVPQPFNAGSTYAEGDIVLFNGSPWVAKKPTQAGDSPASAPGKWLVLDVEAVALKAAHAQQAVADLKLDDLTDVSAPAGTQAGMLLGTTAAGVWGPVVSVGSESQPAQQGPELGSGSGLTQTVTTVAGQTYQVGGTGMTAITVDGAALGLADGWSSFVATGSSHTLVGTGGTVLSVKQVTGTVPPLFTMGGLEVRRRSTSLGIGFNAQRALTTGSYNSAVGVNAQFLLTTGSYNSAVGYNAQLALTTGSYNNAVGYNAQSALTTGTGNNAVGYNAQSALTTGSYNNAVGVNAQRALTTGSYNSAVGVNTQNHDSQKPDVNGSTALGTDSTGVGAYTDRDNTIVLGTPMHTIVLRGPGKGIEMPSADGKRWIVRVTNTGTLEVVAA